MELLQQFLFWEEDKMESKLPLRQIVLEFIDLSGEDYHQKDSVPMIKSDLFEYAEFRGYRGPVTDLFNTADSMNIEDKVLGIYY